jgi:hypothetical protein
MAQLRIETGIIPHQPQCAKHYTQPLPAPFRLRASKPARLCDVLSSGRQSIPGTPSALHARILVLFVLLVRQGHLLNSILANNLMTCRETFSRIRREVATKLFS